MEHHIWLAKEQDARLTEFVNAHPELNRRDSRHAFFSQPYETDISAAIVRDLLRTEYNPEHPIKG